MIPSSQMDSSRPTTRLLLLIAAAAMVVHCALALHDGWSNSATADELVHLSSGWTALHWRDFRLNPEHPPLVKIIAAAPIDSWLPQDPDALHGGRVETASRAWVNARMLWQAAAASGAAQWYFAHAFSFPMTDRWLDSVGVEDPARVRTDRIVPPEAWAWSIRPELFRARAVLLVFPVALAIVLFAWGWRIASPLAACAAVILLAFDPSFIAHGSLVTSDVAAAASIFASVAALAWWMRQPSVPGALALSIATGTAAVVKFSSLALGPLMLILVAGWLFRERSRRALFAAVAGIALAGLGAYAMIWLTYGLRWSATGGEGELDFDTLLSRRAAVAAIFREGVAATPGRIGETMAAGAEEQLGDRLLRTVHEAHVLPEAYTHGIAFVRAFSAPRTAYLNGEYSDRGFPQYFAWTFLYKTPPVLLFALALALLAAFTRRIGFEQIWWLGLPPLFLFLFASMSGVNIGHRHLLVIYPFLWLLAGHTLVETARRTGREQTFARVFIALALLPAFVAISFNGVYPMIGNHLGYMNAFAGGPIAGSEKLTDSNVDWGQDAYRLVDWWNAQEPRPLMAYAVTGATDPRAIQLPVLNTQLGYPFAPMIPMSDIPAGALLAVSRTSKSGVLDDESTRARFREFLSHYELVDRVGYGIEIYAPLQR